MLSLSFLDKLPFLGSYNGIRFRFEKVKNDNSSIALKVYVWKDLYNFESTDKKTMNIKEFEYSKDGIEEGLKFVESLAI